MQLWNENGVENEAEKKRQRYDDGILAKKIKVSGVKKLFAIALAYNTQENYENVEQLWSLLNIKNFQESIEKSSVATDLKMADILSGLQSHSSSYPCTTTSIRFFPLIELMFASPILEILID